MQIDVDRQQATVLRDVLETELSHLRIASARADSHDFRESVYARENVIEALLAKLPQTPERPIH
jgi:hypothetical protein